MAGVFWLVQCSLPEGPIRGNIRLIIGSKSTGGDTYRSASLIAEALAEKLDRRIKVDAIGSTAGFRLLSRVSNGSTIMVFHDQAYLGDLYNKRGYKNIFEDYIVGPTFAINPGNAYLTSKSSKFRTLDDVLIAVSLGETVRVAIQPGGVSEIGFSALKNAIRLRYPGQEQYLVGLNTGSQADKNQLLFDGAVDLIHGSVQANEQYVHLPEADQKAMRFLWLTARAATINHLPDDGYGQSSLDDLVKFAEPQVRIALSETESFTFDKEFFFLYNKETPSEIIDHIDENLKAIFEAGDIQQKQREQFFVPNFKASGEAQAYLWRKSRIYKQMLEALNVEP